MRTQTWLVAAVVTLLVAAMPPVGAAAAAAQHEHSPYAHDQSSEVPSLTPDELEQLRNGDGMGLAKPAELNHFPGPKHVLELATELELSTEQRAQTEEIFAQMQGQAREIGEMIVEAELYLDNRFAHAHIDETVLAESTALIAELYGKLRYTHLRAHLVVTELLTPAQIEEYDRLRGYSG